MRPHVIVTSVVVAVLAAAAAPAAATVDDRASAARFVREATVFVNADIRASPLTRAAVTALVTHVAAGCPGTLHGPRSGTPAQQNTADGLLEEASAEVLLAGVTPTAAAARFTAQQSRLRFTNAALDRTIARGVRLNLRVLALRPPDLCADIAAAAAGGFAQLSPASVLFLAQAKAALPASSPSLAGLLDRMKPYLTPAERPKVAHLRRLERRYLRTLSSFLPRAFDRVGRILTGA